MFHGFAGDRRCEDSSPALLCRHSCPCRQHRDLSATQNWIRCDSEARVSVNVPQFSVPPEGVVSKVSATTSVAACETAMAAASSSSHAHEKRQSKDAEQRNIYITYSSDSSSEMIALVDVLSKHGFQPATGTVDQTCTDVDDTEWEDTFLKDPSTPVIVAISPRYKADIEGCVEDSRGLHTKYIHTLMQHEFIQKGSLNFRFIPVLFLNTSQKHVPGWLQNTRVYRWPQDTDDLLLRLSREERFVPPPVPVELALIIRPVPAAP
ncbi:E3 ubiquitin ligase TRAF3IP2-like [Dunckerocampus dactyliophorus]|uniref:E3 ubiquitin ligase TRAF3IP2-like n=1 Tax=Dunckerocampus dactyliophorus TaxID=161453 RepID=UPI0024060EDB|nr:E3 ubiquitin ligase TRAF3IP2-like [Dunckerocampus dactyliophorus]